MQVVGSQKAVGRPAGHDADIGSSGEASSGNINLMRSFSSCCSHSVLSSMVRKQGLGFLQAYRSTRQVVIIGMCSKIGCYGTSDAARACNVTLLMMQRIQQIALPVVKLPVIQSWEMARACRGVDETMLP